jgi:hypothetical protein
MRLINPAWWSRESRPFYAAALRWTLKGLSDLSPGPDKQRLYALATTCYYQLGLYEKWEAGQVNLGKVPARKIEKSLRWDGVHDFDGKGYQVVLDYLREHPMAGQAEPAAETVPRETNVPERRPGKEP